MAWLAVTPDGSKEPRHKYIQGVELPELPIEEDTHELWSSAGMYSQAGDGSAVPLTWLELDAFARLRGGGESAIVWETVREMSVAYVMALRDTSPLSIPPAHRGNA